MKVYYSTETCGFYLENMKPRYQKKGTWPSDAILLTDDEQATYWRTNPPDGYQLGSDENGRPTWVEKPQPSADTRRAAAKTSIDTAAGTARSRYITVAVGQEGTYQLKADEAVAYIAAGYPDDASAYPMLAAEAAARGMTLSALADEVAAARALWVQMAAQIEALRLAGKAAVDAADDDADFSAIAQTYIDQLAVI